MEFKFSRNEFPPIIKKREKKRGPVLWHAVRKSIPATVGHGPKHRFKRKQTPWFMVNPETTQKRTWDLLLTLAVLYTTIVIPYRVSFRRDAMGPWATFEEIIDLAFTTDIVLNFITGIQLSTGEITYEWSTITKAYLSGWFVIDFFSTLPYDHLSRWSGIGDGDATALVGAKLLRSLKILRLIKLARIRKLNKVFSNLEDAVYTNQSLLSLIKLALTMLFIAHMVACIWFAVGISEAKSWVSYIGLDSNADDIWLLQYLVSMYWAIVTMATIGYGDIVAKNNTERIIDIVIMAIGVSFFGYVIGTISTLVSNLDVAAARYEEQMTIVKEYIISRSLPKPMSKRIRDHFEYYFQNRSVFKEKKILKRLPSALRNEMIHHAHAKLVVNIGYFTTCHESLISDIVMVMRPFSVHKDEFIFVQHEIAAHVFFLLKGKIHLTKTTPTSKADIRLATLSSSEHFGEMEVYNHAQGNGVRITTAVAKSYCELTFLSRQAISKISTSWPEVLRHFKDAAMTASKRMLRREDTTMDSGSDDYSLSHDSSEQTQVVAKSIRPTGKKPSSSRISPYDGSEGISDGQPSSSSPSPMNSDTHRLSKINDDESDRVESIIRGIPLAAPTPSQTVDPSPVVGATETTTLESKDEVTKVHNGLLSLDSFINTPTCTPHQSHVNLLESSPQSDEAPKRPEVSRRASIRDLVMQSTPNDPDALLTLTAPKANPPPRPAPPNKYSPQTLPADSKNESGPAKRAAHNVDTKVHASTLMSLSTRSLQEPFNAMLAKIRESHVTRGKPGSEQLLLKGTYIFHPQESFIVTWQFVIGIGIIYSIVVVPYRLGFDSDAAGSWYWFEMVIDSFFLVDIVLNFRTAYFDDERTLVYNARIICMRYLKGWFVLDFMSTVPIDDIASMLLDDSSNGKVTFLPTKLLRLFRIARLLKLARLVKLSRVAGKLREIVEISPSLERLIKLMLVMSLFCHWNACSFHAVMLASQASGYPGWCKDFFPDPAAPPSVLCTDRVSLRDRYMAAMYWAFTTFTTVGYGDIKPNMYSPYELGLVIVLIVINATAFGYVLSSVINLIRNLDPSDREYKLQMTEMKDYLRDVSVNPRLCSNVKAHYEHNIQSTSLFPEEKIFNKMCPSLRFDIARLVAAETLLAIPLITVMEDSFKGFVSYALFLMKPLCIMRGEKVCRSGGPGTETFFLVEGECDLVNSQTGEGRIIGESAVFEQYSLMSRSEEVYRTISTVTALSKKCTLYSFSIQDYRILEDVSPAVSTYFLSQLAAVLSEDDLFSLSPAQKANVERALRNGRTFRTMADQHNKPRLNSVSQVALAAKSIVHPVARRSSQWSSEILPRILRKFDEEDTDPDGNGSASDTKAVKHVHIVP